MHNYTCTSYYTCMYILYVYMYIHVLYTCTCTGMHMYMYMYINYTCTYVHVPDTFWIYWGWWSEPFLASWGGQGTENSPQETRIGPKPCPLKTNHRSTTPTWLLCILYIHACKASKGDGGGGSGNREVLLMGFILGQNFTPKDSLTMYIHTAISCISLCKICFYNTLLIKTLHDGLCCCKPS